MTNLKNTDIIPISYVPGTGGNFLSALLHMANQNIFEEMKLSEHGNAHGTSHMAWPSASLNTPSITHVKSLSNFEVDSFFNKPYFFSCHILDLLTIMEYFEKSIRIVYDEDDASEILMVFLGKYGIDESGFTDEHIKRRYHHRYTEYKQYSNLHFNLTYEKEFKDRVLFITWKELCYSSVDDLINHLSEFTNIPKHKFSVDNIVNWRRTTISCLDKIKLIINR